ncbi:hypothetical protein E2986_09948 [Frieseomelitta varia]|uniref:glutathione-specific gamma-glutamylcyclotransferase n=1 Tax=Frieseomelitta varia TaxID=561572 RepID=A0A833RY58_9HYME|nr:hypothetical protein E2986_09948 [Frieseomelitta varia]
MKLSQKASQLVQRFLHVRRSQKLIAKLSAHRRSLEERIGQVKSRRTSGRLIDHKERKDFERRDCFKRKWHLKLISYSLKELYEQIENRDICLLGTESRRNIQIKFEEICYIRRNTKVELIDDLKKEHWLRFSLQFLKMEARSNNNSLWVFGYGSLCWYPGFKYKRSAVGHIKGFSRRFWQGNITHRGTAEKVSGPVGVVYGRAFQVQDSAALPYLESRECTLGGYVSTITTFHTREGNRSIPVITYIATNKNEHWLGEAPLHIIAKQISECSGPNGHNVEYLLRFVLARLCCPLHCVPCVTNRLAEFMHRYLPEAHDEHLYKLEVLVRSRIKEMNMCLDTLMGDRDFSIDLDDIDGKDEDHDVVTSNATKNLRKNSFQFTLQVPDKTMRCLKIYLCKYVRFEINVHIE